MTNIPNTSSTMPRPATDRELLSLAVGGSLPDDAMVPIGWSAEEQRADRGLSATIRGAGRSSTGSSARRP
jgi:hypothetical protein